MIIDRQYMKSICGMFSYSAYQPQRSCVSRAPRLVALLIVSWCLLLPAILFGQFDTSDRVSQPTFWPTQTRYSRNLYAGEKGCARCHDAIVQSAESTPMAHAAMPASKSSVLRRHPVLTFAHNKYRYEILTKSGTSIYSVLADSSSEMATIKWAFGSNVAQSWLFERKDGETYEARVTYFNTLNGLDFTPGRALDSPMTTEEAMDRQVGRAEVYQCFACHTTESGTGKTFDESKLIPGVKCEACHGPGRAHIDSIQGVATGHIQAAGAKMQLKIFNPQELTPEESVDFCGACHGSYWDVMLWVAPNSDTRPRFEPYRLEQSKCWNKKDSRLTCIACHDPHKPLDTNQSDYDHVCLSCHSSGPAQLGTVAQSSAKSSCPVATESCTSCHMPQVFVPSMHRSFSDHRIRVAREGEAVPD